MKVRRTNKSSRVLLSFGERTEDRKVSKISSLKTSSKIAKQITKGIYAGGKSSEDVRKIIVKIEGGYSKSQIRRLAKQGVTADPYHYFSFPTSTELQYTPRQVLKSIQKAMEEYGEMSPKKGDGYTMTVPRIRRVSIDYIYMH